MTRRKPRKDANIDQHGGCWRVRYTVDGKRRTVTVNGNREDARAKWNEIKSQIDRGAHVAPRHVTFSEWVPEFIALIEAKRKNARTVEHYIHKLRYAVRAFGKQQLQKITTHDIDKMTGDMKGMVSEGTRRHVFVATKACLAAAQRKGLVGRNPADAAECVDVDEVDVGELLPADAFPSFLAGFDGHLLKELVTVALMTGARRNELLALRHSDVDYKAGKLRIGRALERTAKFGSRFKAPKSGKGRELAIDKSLLGLLKSERDRLARFIAKVEDGSEADLSLIKIPSEALVFPAKLERCLKPRNDADVSRVFRKRAIALGYLRLRFHDLRASHETALLEAGVPVHVVAARCGHSPAMLLKTYAERTQAADTQAAAAVMTLFAS